ncbi:nuclear transport factor 2 family protein [Bradyrhizobium sp. 76]|uniref:nuclear transport factor 2 family protein n=1 Tax=Bradyrhizobium sp. 76 TaxID=2782680 RepID=UPI001FF6FFE7|nr:nuclear transport factor 2 family protein [Bradyrhizobium sp. 76]
MNNNSLVPDVSEFLELWAQTFNVHAPERLVVLYADDALFQGTSSAKLCIGAKEIGTYFHGIATVKMDVWHSVTLAYNVVLVVGNYVFSQLRNGHEVSTPARFTFVLRREDGVWKIVHHHSSAIPD